MRPVADMRLRAIVAALALLATAATAGAQTGIVRGRILADDTGEPIRNARVALEPRDDDVAPAMTDVQGRFSLPAPRGSQSVRASKAGYAAVSVPPAADLEIRLPRGGVIAGRILDEFGEPMPLVTVAAERAPGGRAGLGRVATAETDDAGVYRLFGLPAGEFVVGVAGPRVMVGNTLTPSPTPQDDPRPLRTYFPRAPTILLAQRIPVRAGEAVEGINFTLDAPPIFAGVFSRALPADSARGGTIRGRIVRPDGLPVRHARVLLSSAERLFSPYAIVADDDGEYEFGGLRPGGYRIGATDTSFRTVDYGQRGPGEPGDVVTIGADALADRVDVSIPRGSAVTGRVVDEYGDPIDNANVRVERLEWVRGRPRIASVTGIASRQTDDRGSFRIFGLLPGRYLVGAVVGESVLGLRTADIPGYLRTYFPGSVAPIEAQPIEVNGDGDALNVEFALVHGRLSRIAGRAVRASGAPFDGAVWLMQSARSGAVATPPVRARTAADGTFEFKRLSPGEYVIQAATSRESYSVEGEFGAAFVQVSGDDVTNALVRMSAGSSVSGRVTFDGAPPPEPAPQILVSAPSADLDWRSLADNPVASATVGDDGTWEMAGLNGPRRLRVSGVPAGWTLARILANGADVTDAPMPFGAADQSLRNVEVLLTPGGTELGGTARDARDRPAADATIVVFPTDRALWYTGSRFVEYDGTVNGAFLIQSLPPGEFYVAAVDGSVTAGIEDRLDDRRFLETLTGNAVRVTLRKGQRATVNLRTR